MSKKDIEMSLSREEVLQLLPNLRIPYLKKLMVDVPRQQEILKLVNECFEDNEGANEPQTLIIEGEPRAGKSTVIDYFLENHPSTITDTGKIVPVVYALVISPASPLNLMTALLKGLGDPRADRGTTGNKIGRFQNFVTDCETNMIILDEVHHFLHKGTSLISDDVTNMFKVLIKDKNIACLFIGKKDEVTQVVKANTELDSLFPDAVILEAFSWDETNPKTIKEYRSFLKSIEDLLPFKNASNLYVKDMAARIFVATGGSIGFTIRLIKFAGIQVLKDGRELITIDDLKLSFTRKMAGDRRGIKNPFIGPPPQLMKIHPENPPDNPNGRATNKRSKKKKDKGEGISDVL